MYDVSKYKCYGYEDRREDGSAIPTCIAISTYAGKTVKGVARLSPEDEGKFNWEAGRDLAIARCNEKIARKRAKRATAKVAEARAQMDKAMAYLTDMLDYQANAYGEVTEASTHLKNILDKM